MNAGPADRDRSILLLFLAAAGFVLLATGIKGAVIVDELNYMVSAVGASHGTFTIAGTEHLPPSKELYYFDPEIQSRISEVPPIHWLVPPLYAPIAVPFVWMGWYGLMAINVLSFLAIVYLVFMFVRRATGDRILSWTAAALFALGGYGIEYAQGVWPHMLAAMLTTAAVVCASRSWTGTPDWKVVLAGFLAGMSAGIREQNIVLAFCLGCTVALFGKRRARAAAFFAAGIVIPVLLVMLSNKVRFDYTGVPFIKSGAYLQQVERGSSEGSVLSPLNAFWSKFVDFSAQGTIDDPIQSSFYVREPNSGAYLIGSAVKKALLQSSPWIALSLLAAMGVWVRPGRFAPPQIVPLKALSLIVIPVAVMFSLAGSGKLDGLAFNQRYFHELVPLSAMIAVMALTGTGVRIKYLAAGFVVGILIFLFAMLFGTWSFRHTAILKVPLLLSLGMVISWIAWRTAWRPVLLSLAMGLCIGWAFSVHLGDDLPASRSIRRTNAGKLASLEATIPDHSALFVYWGARDAAGPLQLEKDVVILEVWSDHGATAPALKDALRREGRRVFIYGRGFHPSILNKLAERDSLVTVHPTPDLIYEIIKKED